MRRIFPLSAILAGILVTPGLAAPTGLTPLTPTVAPDGGDAGLGAAEAELQIAAMPQTLREQVEQLRRGRRLSAHGMQDLQRHMARDMRDYLDHALTVAGDQAGSARIFPVQMRTDVGAVSAPTEKAAYLGVATSAVGPLLREQLRLQRGVGLTVDYVDRGSPADAAGLKLYDVLQKLDDQLLINPQQLAVLVRLKKPGDAIALTVIHGGQSQVLSAKLVEKDLPILGDTSPLPMGPAPAAPAPTFPPGWYRIPGTEAVPGDDLWQNNSRITATINPDGSRVLRLLDDQHDVTLTSKNGKSSVVAKDRAGKTVYEGGYTTEAEKAKVPADVAQELNLLEKSSHADQRNWGTHGGAENMTFSRTDGEHAITLHVDGKKEGGGGGGGRTLIIRDLKTNETIFDGPANTDEDLKSLSPDLIAKVKSLMNKVELPN